MASASSIIEDIDDKFCQCCLCFEQYKDPRQLPCLHRYCADCLQKLINRKGGEVKCPLCQEPVDVPKEGAQGLKKDFYMNEIIDYVKVKKSLKDDKLHPCGDCSKTVQASAYCFRCGDFLCNDCHQYHLTRKSLKEHKPHLLSLNDVESKNITLQQLSSLKGAPRCQIHPENVSRLCCRTCSNLPICLTCTYGDHEKHQIKDVIALAKIEKGRLQQRLAPLNECKERVYQTFEKTKVVETEIYNNAEKLTADLSGKHETQNAEYEAKIEAVLNQKILEEKGIEEERKRRATQRQTDMEERIKQIKEEFRKLEQRDDRDIKTKLGETAEKHTSEIQRITKERDGYNDSFAKTTVALHEEKDHKIGTNAEIQQHLDHTIRRFENLTAMSASILVSENSWTVIQNVDNICSATEPLLQDMKREFEQLEQIPKFSGTAMGGVGGRKNVRLPQQVGRVVDIEGIKRHGWYLSDITCSNDGDIVVSGGAKDFQSFITVISMQGKRCKHQLVKPRNPKYSSPLCYCAPFNESKVATACFPDEVGLFDVRDQSYSKKSLRDVIPGWSSDHVTCITTDEANNHVIVGCYNTRDVYVLDDQLNHHSTITLPEMINWPRDITVIDRHLIVCDKAGRRACAVNMKGELQHEFTKPGDKGCDIPFSVCTDSSGFIYILWVDVGWTSRDQNCVVAQYCPDDHRLLSKTSMYTSAVCMTIAETARTEKLLVATWKSGKLHVYELEEVDGEP